jgi:chemotaxis signal transduction protein
MFVNTVLNKWSEIPEVVEPTVELIVFDICEISFGIPIAKIDRIVSSFHLGEDYTLTQDVEILDLHHRLSGKELANPTAIAIFISDSQHLYGIPIETVPSLIEVPLDRIRSLPDEFRTTNPLGIASHIAMISNQIEELTVFILT